LSKATQLYELQLIDLDIDARNETLARVESQLGEPAELAAAREACQEAQQAVAALEERRQRLEWAIEDVQAKVAPLEKKLYGGTVRIPKELTSLQQDVEHLKKHKSELEDETLEVMGELEEAEADLRSKQNELARIEEEWQRAQGDLLAQQAALQQELAALQKRRDLARQAIDAASLQMYEILRPQKRGLAVATIERGMCQGCRITLPSTEIQRVRSSPELIRCSSCGRILCLI
jgi:hypothetical protein